MNLSAKEIEQAKFTFSIYDFDGKNVMDAFNIGDALRALGLNPTLNRIEKLGGTNRRREKTLQVEEFLSIYSEAKKDKDAGSVEDFLECLKCYDKKGEGKMSAAELHHILLSYGEKLDSEESEAILKDCGDSPDEDGLISYKSFLSRLVGNAPDREPETQEVSTSTSSKPKKSKKANAESASASNPPEEETASVTKLKSPKPRSDSITAAAAKNEPKPAPVEKKFQMPLISMKTDALFK